MAVRVKKNRSYTNVDRTPYDFKKDPARKGTYNAIVIFGKARRNDRDPGESWNIGFGLEDYDVRGDGLKPTVWAWFDENHEGRFYFMLRALVPDLLDSLKEGDTISVSDIMGRRCKIVTDWSKKDDQKLWIEETHPPDGGHREDRPSTDKDSRSRQRDDARDGRYNRDLDDANRGYDRSRDDDYQRNRGRDQGQGRDRNERGRGDYRDDSRGRDSRDDSRGDSGQSQRGDSGQSQRGDSRGGYGQTYGGGGNSMAKDMGYDPGDLPF